MLIRTHLAIVVLVILLLLPQVSNDYLFIGVALLASFIPDIDIPFSKLGSWKIFRFLQFFVKHRGVLHSLTIAILTSIIIAIFFPAAAFAFFVGYSVHVFADSFTKEGVEPFWPMRGKSTGWIRTGGYIETVVFVVFILIDILALILLYFM